MRLLLVVLLTLLVAAPARAATVERTLRTEFGQEDGAPFEIATLTFTSGSGEANDLRVERVGDEIAFTERGAPLEAGTGCRSVTPTEVRCPLAEVVARTGDGADRVTATSSVSVDLGEGDDRADGTIGGSGGAGADQLTGTGFLSGGTGDDRLELVEDPDGFSGVQLGGGPGDDVLIASGSGVWLDGGGGRDLLLAGAGAQELTDGDGVEGAPIDADILRGGPGVDSVRYGARARPVVVDLTALAAGSGEAGEGDVLEAIEGVEGGAGDDRLTGDAGPNRLAGEGGRDVLVGAAGRDTLSAGAGDDVLDAGTGDDRTFDEAGSDRVGTGEGDDLVYGGAGTDRIDVGAGDDRVLDGEGADVIELGAGNDVARTDGDFVGDRVDCGAGRDTLRLDRGNRRPRRCERVTRVGSRTLLFSNLSVPGGFALALVVRGGAPQLAIDCVDQLPDSCAGRVRLRARIGARDRPVAAGRFGSDGPIATVTGLRLSAAARREFRQRGKLLVTVVTTVDPGGAEGAIPKREAACLVRRVSTDFCRLPPR